MSEAPKMPPLPESHAELPYGSYTMYPVIGSRSGTFTIYTADQMRAFYLSGWRAAREEAAKRAEKATRKARVARAWASSARDPAPCEVAADIRSMPDPVHPGSVSGEGRRGET